MKVLGVGLNKTGTKTLRLYLQTLGLKHHSYDLECFKAYQRGDWPYLWKVTDSYDSFEDWPWPLLYKEFDARYPDAFFILTVRKDPETWYRSLCKMAVRMGPFNKFEKYIYGYSMPQGQRQKHIDFYNAHNLAVESYFADRPEKFLKISFSQKNDFAQIRDFLGIVTDVSPAKTHTNKSEAVYDGDILWKAQLHRIAYQSKWYTKDFYKRLRRWISSKRSA